MCYDCDKNAPVSLKEWLITLLIMCIPIVNIVMIFVWAFGKNVNPSKSNYFKANLIFVAIELVVITIFWSSIFGVLAAGCMIQ